MFAACDHVAKTRSALGESHFGSQADGSQGRRAIVDLPWRRVHGQSPNKKTPPLAAKRNGGAGTEKRQYSDDSKFRGNVYSLFSNHGRHDRRTFVLEQSVDRDASHGELALPAGEAGT
jgi:hypothetical protein